MQGYREWQVLARGTEAPGVETLRIAPLAGELPTFTPGQFVNVLLPALGPESKSYSIANARDDTAFALTVRTIGAFSRALCALEGGARLQVSLPLGYFYQTDPARPRTLVAGGIGIVPFMSMLRSERGKQGSVDTVLLYSSRTKEDAAFLSELDALKNERNTLHVFHFLTRAAETHGGAYVRRIGAPDLLDMDRRYPTGDFFLCGSIAFVRDMRLHLKQNGIPEERLFTESFF